MSGSISKEKEKKLFDESFLLVQNAKFLQAVLAKWRIDLTEDHHYYSPGVWKKRNEGTFKHADDKSNNNDDRIKGNSLQMKNDSENEQNSRKKDCQQRKSSLVRGLAKYYKHVIEKVCRFERTLIHQ